MNATIANPDAMARFAAPLGSASLCGVSVRLSDCMDVMKEYPDKHFDLAIVDPPYSDAFTTRACADNAAPKGNYNIATLNGHKPTDEYWRELFRVSKHQIVWGANWYGRWFGVGGVCWFKDNSGNYSPCEYAYQSINNHIHHLEYRWNGMLQADMKEKEARIHPTQKPVALYSWLLRTFAQPGQRILDTHLGSGSSAIACARFGCEMVGCEIEPGYYATAVERIGRELQQGVML